MKEFGIPASIILAQALLESGAGNSDLARSANNHFGIKCHKGWEGDTFIKDDDEKNECFRMYKTPEESYADHALFLTSRNRYSSLFELDKTDYKGWSQGLKAAGYATNPAYADRLIGIIERYELSKYDSLMISPQQKPGKKVKKRPLSRVNLSEKHSPETAIIHHHSRRINQHNGVKYVVAQPGEPLKSLADTLQLRPWMLRKFNDFPKDHEIKGGDRVYLQSKKRKGSAASHTFLEGETLFEISQQYGIRLNNLLKRNNLKPGEPVKPGTVLKLR